MKKTYLKIVSIVLTMLMLVGTMTMLVPLTASAEGAEPIYLEKNKTATINGITYRFDTTKADEEESWARINPDGTWEMNIRHGDMLWFPDVKMSDTSSVYGEVTNSQSAPNNYFTGLAYGVTGATAYETTNVAVLKTYNGGMRFRITGASRTGLMTISGDDYGNGGDSPRVYDAKYTPNEAYNSIAHAKNQNWDGGKTVYFKVSQTTDKVEVEFGTPSLGYFVDPSISTYTKGASNTYTLANGSVGYTMVWGSDSHTQVRIDKLDVTNCTVAGEAMSSYSLVQNGTEDEPETPDAPVEPETPSVIELKLNADNYINGYNYRFETNDETGKYARIEDGKLKFFLKSGDIFYISNLTVKDATSSYTIEGMTSPVNDMHIQIANGVSKNGKMYGSGFAAYNWKGFTWDWTGAGNSVSNTSWTFNNADHDSQAESWGGTKSQGAGKDAIWAANEVLSIKTTFDVWADLVPTTHFYEGYASLDGVGASDMKLRWYPHAGSCAGESFGIIVTESNGGEVSIDKITATNMNEADSYVETFDIQVDEPETPETPETPDVVTYMELVPNADNWINGQNYRFETSKAESYAKIENGKLVIKMSEGDLFWIPTLTVKDTTSEFSFTNMRTDKDGTRIAVATHIEPKQDGVKMYSSGIANNGNNVWLSNRLKWNGNGVTLANYDQHYKGDVSWSDSTKAPTDGNWQISERLDIRNVYATWSRLIPKTIFNVGSSAAAQFVWYPSLDTGCENTSFGLTLASGSGVTISIDTITAANMNGVDSYSETFDAIEVPVAVKDAAISLSLDGTIGLNFAFEADTSVLGNATIVATKNGVKVDEQAVVDGANLMTVPVAAKEMGDDVNFSIVVDGAVFDENSYTTSVAAYANKLKEDAEWTVLMNAMLNYGAAAQNLLGYKTDALVGNVDAIAYDFSGYEAVVYEGDRSLLTGLYTNLTLESDTTLKLYFKPAEGVELSVTVDGEAAELVDNGDGYYVLSIEGIAADKLDYDCFIVVNNSLSFKVNALDWAKLASANADANIANVAKALAAYGDAASKKA